MPERTHILQIGGTIFFWFFFYSVRFNENLLRAYNIFFKILSPFFKCLLLFFLVFLLSFVENLLRVKENYAMKYNDGDDRARHTLKDRLDESKNANNCPIDGRFR